MINEIINTCASLTGGKIELLARYSHIIPVILSIILGTFLFIKTKYDLFSKVFLSFIVIFSLWLIGDLITWTSTNYTLIYTAWSVLLYLEIIFYVLGLYFALVFIKKTTISSSIKIILLIITLPAFILTITQQSVLGFNHSYCEAFNNNFLDQYKLAIEAIILTIILLFTITPLFNKTSWKIKKTNLVVLGSMFLFLSTFGITEYLASVTGNYEMNLYSLFLLPVFLVAIIYSVFELDIFNVKTLGTHYLVVGLVVLMGGQLFFITDTTSKLITGLAMILAGVLSVILFRNLKRESDQRTQIAKLNVSLQDSIKQRESLVHLVTHKVKGSFTRTKYLFAGMLDGTFGEISPEIKRRAQQGLEFDDGGIKTVDLVLNVANLQNGFIKYDMKPVDFKKVVTDATNDKKITAEAKNMSIETTIGEDSYNVLGDVVWLKEAVNNLVDNSIKYSREGKILVNLEKKDGKILLSVKDNGIGITEEDKKNLFTEGGRGKDSIKVNVDSTGYGLYSVKLIVEAHKGRVWADSEGEGKGSTFYIELPATS
ncbi:MAG: HAMP domain-containing sensor histidine kinase [Candidatus Parcubacteria bacterium]|nr:HAMP domain-containing sensor histidine kinase [Candidatus Parcubacteria bacterium]